MRNSTCTAEQGTKLKIPLTIKNQWNIVIVVLMPSQNSLVKIVDLHTVAIACVILLMTCSAEDIG